MVLEDAFPAYISRFPLFLGVRRSHPGLRRYRPISRPISRPIFLVVRFNSFIHSFQYHSVHQGLIAYIKFDRVLLLNCSFQQLLT